jgi:hypothetical protein
VPGKAPKRPAAEDEPFTPAQAAKEIEGLGGIVDRSETGIEWNKGTKEQNGEWEDYYDKINPDSRQLPPGSKRFDHFNDATGEATSNKTLNTLSMSYIRDPQEIYRKVTRYVNDAVNYEPAGDQRIRLVLLLTHYFEDPVYSIGRRQAGQIDKPQFGFLRRLLAKVRQNFAIAAGPSKGSHWFAVNGTRPRDEVADAVATKELDVVKSLHQAGKQHVKSLADIVVSFVCGVRQ